MYSCIVRLWKRWKQVSRGREWQSTLRVPKKLFRHDSCKVVRVENPVTSAALLLDEDAYSHEMNCVEVRSLFADGETGRQAVANSTSSCTFSLCKRTPATWSPPPSHPAMRQAWFRKKMTFQEVLKPNVTRKITLCSSCMHTSWTIYTPTNWQCASISDMHVHADAPTSEWKHLKEAEIDHYLALITLPTTEKKTPRTLTPLMPTAPKPFSRSVSPISRAKYPTLLNTPTREHPSTSTRRPPST